MMLHNILVSIIGISSLVGIGFAVLWVFKNAKPIDPGMERKLREYYKDYRTKHYDVRDNL